MPSEKGKMLASERYDASAPELVAERERARELTAGYNHTAPDEQHRRRELLAELFGSIDDEITVEPPFRCDYGSNVHVGSEFYANVDCVVLEVCRVAFGDQYLLGPEVHVYTATLSLDPNERATGLEYGTPVPVGDDVPVGTVVQGNRAEVVRQIETDSSTATDP